MKDLHGAYIKYTPDDLVDFRAYSSGVLRVKIHEVQLPSATYAYAQLAVDSLLPQFKTAKLRGRQLAFNETGDAFIKETDFSRVAIEIKYADSDEKDDAKIGHWISPANSIIKRIQRKRRELKQQNIEFKWEDDEGDWYDLLGTQEQGAAIRLSFDFLPCADFVLNPDESLDSKLK